MNEIFKLIFCFLVLPSLVVAIGLFFLGFNPLIVIFGLVFLALSIAIVLLILDFKPPIVFASLVFIVYVIVISLIFLVLIILSKIFANLSTILVVSLIIGLIVLLAYLTNELAIFTNTIVNGIDLSRQDLTGKKIRNKYLRKANLTRSILCNEDLSGKSLVLANLSHSNLSNANFSGTNLSNVNLSGADLSCTNFNGANLSNANLSDADLSYTNFNGANLSNANLSGANLSGKDLSGINLRSANLNGVNFSGANLSRVNFIGADLTYARLNEANVKEANFEGCKVFGVAAWGLNGEGSNQSNLIITKENEPTITVDGLTIANLIYLMLQGDPIKDVLDTLTTKSVLILGRFTNERLEVLRAIQKELRNYNYVPILFDFEKPANRNIIETVSTVAHLSRFIIADLTEPQAIPGELTRIIPNLIVPVIPIFQPSISKQNEWGMFWDFKDYDHVLSIYDYENTGTLLKNINEKIILPAEHKVMEISKKREKNQKDKMERREKNILPTVDHKVNWLLGKKNDNLNK
jgi:uncharacterized protein YjbI with pentapeptide repeats